MWRFIVFRNSNFADLPIDVLELVLGFECTSHKVLDLWKCGNRRLNCCLSNSSLEIVLKDEKWQSKSRFPKLLRQLRRLKALTIYRGDHSLMDPNELGIELQNLSPTLEVLKLELFEAESCLLRSVDCDIKELSWLNSDEPSSFVYNSPEEDAFSKDVAPSPGSRLWNIGAFFPRLTTLSLQTTWSSLSPMDLLGLPSTLTRFTMTSRARQDDRPLGDLFASLPRGLLALTLSAPSWTVEDIRKLPPNLTELKTLNCHLQSLLEQFEALPKSITLLYLGSPLVPLTLENFQALPPGLQNLALDTLQLDTFPAPMVAPSRPFCSSIWTPFLPKHLTTLKLPRYDRSMRTESILMAHLPRTLTKLCLPLINWDLNRHPQFPPRLESLALRCCDEWSLEEWKLLPQNGALKVLKLAPTAEAGYLSHRIFALLPRSLKRLVLNQLALETQCFLPGLPEGLESLEYRGPDWIHFTAGSVDPASLHLLPKRLTSLYLPIFRSPSCSEAKDWPPSLRQLTICVADTAKHPTDFLLDVPPSVRRLSVLYTPGTFTRRHFSQFPRELEFFRVMAAEGAEVEPDAFLGLPPSLLELDVKFKTNVAPECLAHLPRALNHLDLNLTSITDAHLEMLPRTLRTARFSCAVAATITRQCAKHFPVHLSIAIFQSRGRPRDGSTTEPISWRLKSPTDKVLTYHGS